MGNCIKKESATQWGGEDWGSEALFSGDESHHYQDSSLSSNSSATKRAATEVKVKITKKQLEELLGRVDTQGMSVQQLLAQLMDGSDQYEAHQRAWRPTLKSIPEV